MKKSKQYKQPILIKGDKHKDHRGELSFVNDFDMSPIQRIYTIQHPSTSIVRAWQGHKRETKYFKCIEGRFLIAAVAIDDWDNPSKSLTAQTFILDSKNIEVLVIPAGYANGFKALDSASKLMVFSDMNLESAKKDDYRFDENLWMDWH